MAFCAKPVVREEADVVVDEPDLRLVLDVLGVPRPLEPATAGAPDGC